MELEKDAGLVTFRPCCRTRPPELLVGCVCMFMLVWACTCFERVVVHIFGQCVRVLYVWAESNHVFEVPLSNTRLELRHFKFGLSTRIAPDAVLRPNRVLVAAHRQKLSVPQAAPSKIAAVKPAAAASAATPRTQRDSRTAIRTMVLQSAALIARNKGVARRLHPSQKRP